MISFSQIYQAHGCDIHEHCGLGESVTGTSVVDESEQLKFHEKYKEMYEYVDYKIDSIEMLYEYMNGIKPESEEDSYFEMTQEYGLQKIRIYEITDEVLKQLENIISLQRAANCPACGSSSTQTIYIEEEWGPIMVACPAIYGSDFLVEMKNFVAVRCNSCNNIFDKVYTNSYWKVRCNFDWKLYFLSRLPGLNIHCYIMPYPPYEVVFP